MTGLIVFCTCPDRECASSIARSLVHHRLAACVSMLPEITSVYRWQGGVEQAQEVQLLIKTTTERFEELKVHVVMMHPYELPELIAVEAVAGLDRYLGWIGESTAPAADS